MATAFPPPTSDYTVSGTYYPTGHTFAMVRDEAAARAVIQRLKHGGHRGEMIHVAPEAIVAAFGERVASAGEAPSVGREEQFMARFVELARAGKHGLLIDMAGGGDVDAVADALAAEATSVAYCYRTLVIEELIAPTPRAEAAGADDL